MDTFPFKTCETVSATGLAQPVSASINVASCAVVFYYWIKNKSPLLLAVLLFQAFHVFSHSVHIPGAVHTNVAHALAYLVNAALLSVGYRRTRRLPRGLVVLVAADLYAFFNLPLLFYVTTQAALFVALDAFYTPVVKKVKPLAATAAVILLLVLNEKYNCDQMLAAYPTAPFHALIESAGLVFFFLVSQTFYKF